MPRNSGRRSNQREVAYAAFDGLNGEHSLRDVVPEDVVDYVVRERKGGVVKFFNFGLAKRMGLIADEHPDKMTKELETKLLSTFSLQIVNEYDLLYNKISRFKLKPGRYMATRYLQLQHNCKKGRTSGDGRSIWNGQVTYRGKTWDVSSCGTGATKLSPAAGNNNKLYETGDPSVSYGCGYSTVSEGYVDALFSEVLEQDQVDSEKILCVIGYAKGYGITVRAGLNLLRPSHFFMHLKQNRRDSLKALVDFYYQRQIKNGVWKNKDKVDKYSFFAKKTVETFAKIAAQFEAKYVFCWLDWDGDNILLDGGIIDFGSVRRFGLCYHDYRFDDDQRWSTNLKEQRIKAEYTARTLLQLIDFVSGNVKPSLDSLRQDRRLKDFWKIYEDELRLTYLQRVGFSHLQSQQLLRFHRRTVNRFLTVIQTVERYWVHSGWHQTPDGKTRLPLVNVWKLFTVDEGVETLEDQELLDILATDTYGVEPILQEQQCIKQVRQLIRIYQKLLESIGQQAGTKAVNQITSRAKHRNMQPVLTGDGICVAVEDILRWGNRLMF